MITFLIFLGISSAIAAGGAAMIGIPIMMGNLQRMEDFPIKLPCGARMSDNHPFPVDVVNAQLEALADVWMERFVQNVSFSNLNIDWENENILVVEPSYVHPDARVPFAGAEAIWQTGLAHEAAHHILHPDWGEPDDVFGDRMGVVRFAREQMGMHEYPR